MKRVVFLGLWLALTVGTVGTLTLLVHQARKAPGPRIAIESPEKTPRVDLLAEARETDGNANGFQGGDPMDGRLAEAREVVSRSLALVEAGFETDSLCAPQRCDVAEEGALCSLLRALPAERRKACRDHIISHAAELERLSSEKVTPFRLSDAPLAAGGRPVSAVTTTAPDGPITFHYGTLRALTSPALVALLGHELSHKLGIDDRQRELLDAAGAAIAVYAREIAAPRGTPPQLGSGHAVEEFCSTEFDPAKHYLMAISMDAGAEEATAEQREEWKASFDALRPIDRLEAKLVLATRVLAAPEARRAAVRELFQRFYLSAPSDRELDTTMRRIAEGMPYDVVAASIAGDPVYLTVRSVVSKSQFFSSIFRDIAGRLPSATEAKSYGPALDKVDRATLALALLHDAPGLANLVNDWYLRYLGRRPSPGELAGVTSHLRAGVSWEAAQAEIVARPEYVALQALRFRERCPTASGHTESRRAGN